MTDAIGPIFAAGFQHITSGGYPLLYLPDLHNDELQREGKAPVYWWLPNAVRLAQKDNGDFKFSMLHFEGIRSEDTNVGVTGTEEVAGGLLGFSTTTAPPASALQDSQDELLNRFRGSDDKYWGWRTSVAPQFRPAPIVSNTTTVTNLSPNADGTVPAATSPAPGGPAGGPPGRGRASRSLPPGIRSLAPAPVVAPGSRTVQMRDGYRDSNFDPWYINLQGQGSGSVNPFAENAYSGLMGSYPAAVVWNSFHAGSSGISVWQNMRIKCWTPMVHILLEGDWDKIQDHLSAALAVGDFMWSAGVQAEFNNMVMNGTIKAQVEVDTSLPNADKLQAEIDKRKDLVFQKFMDQAQKAIFDPAPYTEQPAEAHGGGFLGLGGGAAVKLRRDHSHLHLRYEENDVIGYLQEYPVSGELEGLYDEIKADPTAEKKYFRTLYLGDWERKVPRVVKPVVNWPNAAQKWVGEPVAFLSAQIGYPNTEGVVQWDGHVFQPSDGPDAVWNTATEMKAAGDVANAPAGWTPDKTFLKRQIHLTEPPSDLENPFARIQVEQNVVDLDPGDLGSLVDDINLEVRVDNVGVLAVGPIFLDVDLENAKQVVEVVFKADGKTHDGIERVPVKFSWKFDDQDEPRYWMVFTGQPDFVPRFTYQVRVIVKGSIFTKGMEWLGPEQTLSASGPLMVSVPTPEDPGVQTRSLVPGAAAAPAPAPAPAHAPATPPPAATGKPPVPAAPPARRSIPEPVKKTPLSELLGWSAAPAAGSKDVPAGAGTSAKQEPGSRNGDTVFTSFEPVPPGH